MQKNEKKSEHYQFNSERDGQTQTEDYKGKKL